MVEGEGQDVQVLKWSELDGMIVVPREAACNTVRLPRDH